MAKVNVGTIGHIDHPRILIVDGGGGGIPADVVLSLAERTGSEISVMSREEADKAGLAFDYEYQEPMLYNTAGFSTHRNYDRKREKKAKLRELQRRAFLGE